MRYSAPVSVSFRFASVLTVITRLETSLGFASVVFWSRQVGSLTGVSREGYLICGLSASFNFCSKSVCASDDQSLSSRFLNLAALSNQTKGFYFEITKEWLTVPMD